jgi:predicted nucleotidyltransferase
MMGQRMKTDEVDGVALTTFASLARGEADSESDVLLVVYAQEHMARLSSQL